MNDFAGDLLNRGLLQDCTANAIFPTLLTPQTLYCGFDPTSDSLHLGSLQMIMLCRRFQNAGHKIIALVGGGTGLIGDPSGKADERLLKSDKEVRQLAEAIKSQIRQLLPDAEIVDNRAWIEEMSAISFLRDVGKHFTINSMLAKDSVSSRQLGGEGISFTEFSYMLLQALDFATLFDKGATIQLGGSDQWGNITAGISLIRKTRGKEAHGITSPLLLKSDGTKFGKSESGTVWLAKEKTSAFALFQFLLNVSDEDVIPLLKKLTLRSLEEIEQLSNTKKHLRLSELTPQLKQRGFR